MSGPRCKLYHRGITYRISSSPRRDEDHHRHRSLHSGIAKTDAANSSRTVWNAIRTVDVARLRRMRRLLMVRILDMDVHEDGLKLEVSRVRFKMGGTSDRDY